MVKAILTDISDYVGYIQIAERLSIIDRLLETIYDDDILPRGDAENYIYPLMKGVQEYEETIRETAASFRQNMSD